MLSQMCMCKVLLKSPPPPLYFYFYSNFIENLLSDSEDSEDEDDFTANPRDNKLVKLPEHSCLKLIRCH